MTSGASSESEHRKAHWDDRYQGIGVESVSWYQTHPRTSLELIDLLEVAPSTAVIDVGGGASTLVDALVQRGFGDITVLDISAVALSKSRRRLTRPAGVTWLHSDLLTWRPDRRWGVWHDRAVFHFLTASDDQATYMEKMRSALRPGGAFVIGAFAADGPRYCSGLPVVGYDASTLIDRIGAVLGDIRIVGHQSESHVTPSGGVQPFTWIAGLAGLRK